MLSAIFGLVGTVVGGALVLLGERRAEARQVRREMLRLAWENAGVVISLKRRHRRLCLQARSEGRTSLTAEEKDMVSSEGAEDTRFYMLPVGERLRESIRAVHKAARRLEDCLDASDGDFETADQGLRQEMLTFEAEMRRHLGERA